MSDYYDDEFNFRYGTTRRVKGGIKARTTRGAFGNTWWAARWIAVLEGFDIGGRLGRGKAYARKGQVLDLDISEGLVKASVQGSQRQPYTVEVRIKTVAAEKWIVLAQTSLRQIVIASKLLAGQMPENIEQLMSQAGASLFPTRADDLQTKCSCPDYSNPCKHIAAVYYLIGEEFDRDPFLLFKLRGMTKDKLLDLILGDTEEPKRENSQDKEPAKGASPAKRKPTKNSAAPAKGKGAGKPTAGKPAAGKSRRTGLGGEVSGTTDAASEEGVSEAGSAKAAAKEARAADIEAKERLPADANEFWKIETLKDDLIGSVSAPSHAATLLKRLGPLPFWRSEENLFNTLAPIYTLAGERALQILGHASPEDQPVTSRGDKAKK